ncbi:Biopolymer transport protein ExbD/TolR [Tritonibacter multivorans]|uniref:Biopolymer transport protein ExbD/TolR n=1 Tax=Tritonibacter multivorans TaxID=928856 RepID=A0A0P1GEW3_9RHOB|nr:biopolymer transporter ExbD [Tritonibacter multivorans]MDA7422478.1 biopolymer transporter ExbD [Tritonibacter multivorans]CUH74866.1 Biopolymer transport protein ExbD/TolR [Tritonibacter multivorans]SFD42844.1 outer membrane transport energization protein ExbD (TC 2.C.1.1.1) [Tritonibacter multivorans]
MDFSTPTRRKPAESIVPMINVVFLLLIFFLMTSRLAQPDPFEIVPPEAALEAAGAGEQVLFISSDGRLSFAGQEGDAALVAIAGLGDRVQVLQIRADAKLEAARLARILRQLAEAGRSAVELAVSPK